jgi:hypothetical protein
MMEADSSEQDVVEIEEAHSCSRTLFMHPKPASQDVDRQWSGRIFILILCGTVGGS